MTNQRHMLIRRWMTGHAGIWTGNLAGYARAAAGAATPSSCSNGPECSPIPGVKAVVPNSVDRGKLLVELRDGRIARLAHYFDTRPLALAQQKP
jgi:hypothetical protein